MNKYSFSNDYSEGCHPNILKTLADTNLQQQLAYGNDDYSVKAKKLIQNQLGQQNKKPSEIVFVSGGTQANLIITAAILRPHEALISANTGHITSREAGAIESTGHKIISKETNNGKLNAALIQEVLNEQNEAPHTVKPKMVYISNATETGLIYTKAELQEISDCCRKNNLYLFLDGARLGSALTSKANDVTLADLTELTDIFWIGGTKAGALIGEAIVINHPKLIEDFNFHIKQRGAMLAKGRLLGVQFYELFKDDLFFDLSRQANLFAETIANAFIEKGYQFELETVTNQLFPIISNKKIKQLEKKFTFYTWKTHDENHSVVRLVTSWASNKTKVDEFIELL